MKRALIPAALAALALSIPAAVAAQDVQKQAAGKPAGGMGTIDMDKHMTQMMQHDQMMQQMPAR